MAYQHTIKEKALMIRGEGVMNDGNREKRI